ncbi:hypothetical protein [Hyperthermus butylicus]|uniref:Uncharacterized protein n=1 Tax=Hyperthermus butylicus (strain DSM 5456 / JCM 9403 / PLM1-5) TaxID=415426 RepID=A2BMJ6_HYPBU|nr:hypothetical protein [Hyperthermus butylicus]ABM81207.1 hypothetical protein Hbut_1382 [Hyperthermus butylicus DSM 5456]
MAFASGFMIITQPYRSEPKRSEVRQHLERLGFELYEVGKDAFIVFYVEAPTLADIEEIIKAAERHEGIAKAYVVYAFAGDNATKEWINWALERGEIELDESMMEYIRNILVKLKGPAGTANP